MSEHLPNLDLALFDVPPPAARSSTHKPRILLLYGSNRERSFSRLLVEEGARLLEHFGAETRVFNPSGLPLPDDVPVEHPKVQELRDLVQWSEGQVWCSPERHGAMSAVFKAQIDWIPWHWERFAPPKARPLRSCRCAAVRSRSTWSTNSACSAAGCGCSPSRINLRCPRPT